MICSGSSFTSGTDLSVYSQTHLNKVARQLNERPRKTLAFEPPAERFNACVAESAILREAGLRSALFWGLTAKIRNGALRALQCVILECLR